jgi:exopolysaccharide biosynthesis protein
MKKFLLIFLFACSHPGLSAQQDSAILYSSEWEEQQIASGVTYRHILFKNGELFRSDQSISIIEVKGDAPLFFEILPSPVLINTSKIAKEKDALAAINGSFFKFNDAYNTIDYNSVDYIRKDNKELAPDTFTSGNMRAMHQLGAIAIYRKELYILKADELKKWEKFIQADEVLTSGPVLITDGNKEEMKQVSFYTTRHPRTALGKRENGDILMITVDGRAKEASGMTLSELQSLMGWLGCRYAINLDGGGSTTMYINGFSNDGVVNYPSDNKKFDHEGERKVANAILLHYEN